MSTTDEFMKFCTQVVEIKFGSRSNEILKKAQSKKNLIEPANINDFEEFIDLIESNSTWISGKKYAANVCNTLRARAEELVVNKEATELGKSLNIEASELNVNDFLAKINAKEINPYGEKEPETTGKQEISGFSINSTIEGFLKENPLPMENQITRFATEFTLKNGGETVRVKKEIIDIVKFRMKNVLRRDAIKEEIGRFITRFTQPTQTDIDDFIKYIHLLNLGIQEDELRSQIEKERLFRKFSKTMCIEMNPELNQLVYIVNTCNDKKDIGLALQEKDLKYLIEDDSGISDKLLNELVELLILIESDSLQGIYLKQMVKKTL